MDNEIKHFTYISIELIASSIIIAAIVLTMSVAALFMQTKESKDLGTTLVRVQADFYPYTQKGNDLHCSDVIDLISTYARVYEFAVVYKSGNTIHADLLLTSSDSLDEWSMTKIREKLEDNYYNNYQMLQVLTIDGDSLIGIAFLDSSSHWTESDYDSIRELLRIESKSSYK